LESRATPDAANQSALESVRNAAILRDVMDLSDPHLFRPDPRRLWNALADRVEAAPDSLGLPLRNIERWLAHGRLQAAPLLEWRRRLEQARAAPEAFAALIQWMRADNYDSEPLKSCSPFPGLLSEMEWLALCEAR
jgi:hypothetical protein